MKRLAFLSVLYIYLETGLCIEKTNISPVKENSDAIAERSPALHSTLVKRNTAFKRLPAWSVYYGKRSGGAPFGLYNSDKTDKDESDSFTNVANEDLLEENYSDSNEKAFPRTWMYNYLDQSINDEDDILNSDTEKRSNLKRLQPWMSTYGKRSDGFLDSNIGYDMDEIETDGDNEQDEKLSKGIYNIESRFDIDDLKGAPFLNAKRLAGWSATYGKRAPWGVTYGKRDPWGVTYGKRAPWGVTYGKRDPWGVTYGKRDPWGVTYGKRAPWSVTYGKRDPWGITYGKRAPWSVTYGKRAPWYTTYGKRSQRWQALYGKRAPMWQAVYGKRSADGSTSEVKNDIADNTDNNSDIENTKRASQAWAALYGR